MHLGGATAACGDGRGREARLLRLPQGNPLERTLRETRQRTVSSACFEWPSALDLAAVKLRHIAGTASASKRQLNIGL
jgi:hypothetical protein